MVCPLGDLTRLWPRWCLVAGSQSFLTEYESLHSGRTAGWVSGIGLSEIVRAVVLDTREIFPCSVILDGEYGRRGFSAGVPARIGRGGVNEVLELPLSDDEKSELAAAFDFLENTAQTVRGLLS